jgi:hypothetical protein
MGGTPGAPSPQAPFQRFHLIDRLPPGLYDRYLYRVAAVYSSPGKLIFGREVQVTIDRFPSPGAIAIGFTRGILDRAGAGPLRPSPHDLDFDTRPYEERYRSLGGSAYGLMTEFIGECVNDPKSNVDVFAFDLNHPDILKSFEALGSRLRIALDDYSPAHKRQYGELETRLKDAGCQVYHVHFGRMSHNKVIVRSIDGQPAEILTGSANFSINSLFAQQNHVIVIRNARVAKIYAEYFNGAITP